MAEKSLDGAERKVIVIKKGSEFPKYFFENYPKISDRKRRPRAYIKWKKSDNFNGQSDKCLAVSVSDESNDTGKIKQI